MRFILVAPEDATARNTMGRVERLYHLDGGTNAGVVFFTGDAGTPESVSSFLNFQIE